MQVSEFFEGREYVLEYDENGKLLRETLPSGRVLTYIYKNDEVIVRENMNDREKEIWQQRKLTR